MKRTCCLGIRSSLWLGVLALLMASQGAFVYARYHQNQAGEEHARAALNSDKESLLPGSVHQQSASAKEEIESIAACSKVAYGKQPQSELGGKEQGDPAEGNRLGEIEPMAVVPPNPDGPTLVDLGLYVQQISEINEMGNSFVVDAFMDLVWCDPRLAYDDTHGTGSRIYLEEVATEKITEIWWPDVTFSNEVGSLDAENQELFIYPDGTVEYEEKISIRLEAHFDLHLFPFDTQYLELEIESFAWPQHALQLHREANKIGFGEKFELPEWRTVGYETEIGTIKEIRDRDTFSEFKMTIEVERQYGFYLWKVLLPLILLVIISWVVFWMTEIEIADRMGISFTCLLTVVAYQFIATNNLPAIPYFTLMDGIISISFAVMILSVFENLLVHVLIADDRKRAAVRLDRNSRYLLPLIYLLSLTVFSKLYLNL